MAADVAEKRITKRRVRRRNHEDHQKSWADLPQELLELIMQQLGYVDHVNISLVCKSWYSMRNVPTLVSRKQDLPWLLAIDTDNPGRSCKLFNPMYKKTYSIDMDRLKDKIKDLKNWHVHKSKCGWLLISPYEQYICSTRLIMYSPFYENHDPLMLPSLGSAKKLVATFTFGNSASSYDDCLFVALTYTSDHTFTISTFRKGHTNWTARVFNSAISLFNVKVWMLSDELVYYITYNREAGYFDAARQVWSKLAKFPVPVFGYRMTESDDGELYIIGVNVRDSGWSSIMSCNAAYRLELRQAQVWTWELMDCLGDDKVMFLGDGYNAIKTLTTKRKDIANKVYYCSGSELKYSNFSRSRSHCCSKHYGSLAKERQYIKILIEPPRHHHLPS